MNSSRKVGIIAAVGAIALLTSACAQGTTSSVGGADTSECKSITVLTNRTDLIDTLFQDYATKFASDNKGVKVKFEAVNDYEAAVKTRMNTKDYGDVLSIPGSISPSQYADFFTPLGSVDDMAKTYRFIGEGSADGTVYGLAVTGNAGGYLVNQRIWAEAGITTPPTTPEDFLADLKQIKANTAAIPLYDNYKDAWPFTQYEGFVGLIDGPDARNNLTTEKTPWAVGSEHYVADSIIFDAVKDGLTEPDPATTAWENSKTLLATGEVATMVLKSWAVTQIQGAATTAGTSPEDIAFWPLPVQSDGSFQSTISGDYKLGINKNSQCQATSRKFVDFFINDSGYAYDQGGISPRLDGKTPSSLGAFDALQVKYVELTPPPAGSESLLADIEKASNITISSSGEYRQKLVDIARGAVEGTKQSYFDELNAQWAAGVATVG